MSVVLGPLLLVLASIGIYAVVAYTVSHRTTEIGFRLSLGATAERVVVPIVPLAVPTGLDPLGLRGEFLAMTGLKFAARQTGGLHGMRLDHAVTVVTELERGRCLMLDGDGSGRRAHLGVVICAAGAE